MKLLADENMGMVRRLRDRGHDVLAIRPDDTTAAIALIGVDEFSTLG